MNQKQKQKKLLKTKKKKKNPKQLSCQSFVLHELFFQLRFTILWSTFFDSSRRGKLFNPINYDEKLNKRLEKTNEYGNHFCLLLDKITIHERTKQNGSQNFIEYVFTLYLSSLIRSKFFGKKKSSKYGLLLLFKKSSPFFFYSLCKEDI